MENREQPSQGNIFTAYWSVYDRIGIDIVIFYVVYLVAAVFNSRVLYAEVVSIVNVATQLEVEVTL